jgi:hypothetical protein
VQQRLDGYPDNKGIKNSGQKKNSNEKEISQSSPMQEGEGCIQNGEFFFLILLDCTDRGGGKEKRGKVTLQLLEVQKKLFRH